jgi:hypothetical protein
MSDNNQPNPIAVVLATALLNPRAVKPMLVEGLRQAAGIGLQALGKEIAQCDVVLEPQENPDKERR